MRKRKPWLQTLVFLVQATTLAAAVAALVVSYQNSRRLDVLDASHKRLGETVMWLCEQDGRGGGLVPAGLPPDWARGGELVIRLRQRPMALNPLLIRDADGRRIAELVCEPLASRDPDTLEFRPCLAADWQLSDDQLTWTFHLNPVARFSDDTPVTADDVVFTFDMLRDPRVRGQASAAFLSELAEVRAVNRQTVAFRFARPYFLAFAALADSFIVPRRVYDRGDPLRLREAGLADKLQGSGPFVVEKVDFSLTASEVVLRRNEAYWDRGHVPALDRIRFRVVDDDQRAYELLQTRAVGMMCLSPEQFGDVAGNENFLKYYQVFHYYTPEMGYVYLGWNCRRAPLDDARVRRALGLLVPRDRIVKDIYAGHARPTALPFWSEGPQYPPGIVPAPTDPVAAGKLLDEAGWTASGDSGRRSKDGVPLRIRLLAVEHEKRQRALADFLVAEARQAGLEITVDRVTWTELLQRLERRDFDAVLSGWSTALETDPYLFWHSSQTGQGGLNFVGFSSAEADRLTEAIRGELDPAARSALLRQLAVILEREQPYTTILESETLVAVSARFRGVQQHKLGLRPRAWYIPRLLPQL